MSNPTLELLQNRRSIRAFTGDAVEEAHLEQILRAGQQAATSINGQQISLIVTRDVAQIAQIAEIAGGQPQVRTANIFITVVMDFNRTAIATEQAGEKQLIHESSEALVVGAIDAGIMLNALQIAANSLGYGSTAIGGIRRDSKALIELLKLPEKTFPLVGMTLGVPDEKKVPQVKPRVPLNSFAMNECYDNALVAQGVKEYDAALRLWWDQQGLTNLPSYQNAVAGFYKTIYCPSVTESLQQQGFLLK